MSHPNRRQFLIVAGATACACMFNVAADAAEAAEPLDIGLPDDYPEDGIYDRFAKAEKVLVMRKGDRIYACSALCTHKRQTLRVKEGRLGCPAHSSTFSIDGAPISGPAKNPLDRFAIKKTPDGRLQVDRTRRFGEDQWDEAEAFVLV